MSARTPGPSDPLWCSVCNTAISGQLHRGYFAGAHADCAHKAVESHSALVAQVAALREALKHALVYIEHPEVRRITNEFSLPSDGFILNCRAALALVDGGK